MSTVFAVFTQDKIMRSIPYQLICETYNSSVWRTAKTRQAYKQTFTDVERKQARALFKKASDWTLKTGVPKTIRLTPDTYVLWKKLGRFCETLIPPAKIPEQSNDNTPTELTVMTPSGKLVARDCSEDNYPGVAVLRIDDDGKEAGAVIVDYDVNNNTFNVRVYSPDDPDGDPVADHVFPVKSPENT